MINDEITITPVVTQTRFQRLAKHLLQVAILLPLVAGIFAYRFWIVPPAPDPIDTTSVPTSISAQTLEERFGVQIRLLGVTAAGGMIDLRYKVLDKEKAAFLVGEASEPPVLIAETSGITLALDTSTHGMKHNTRLENNQIYFHFFPNTQNAVKPGSPVTIVFGSVRLAPIVAQ